jgi:DNA-binding transcriptional LysR family regulator
MADPTINIHHLELFYYVARHGGIVKACQNMPYGIQQPAVSAQLLKLEAVLGMKLFERRPFKLTAEGLRLFEFTAPFFNELPRLVEGLRHPELKELRVAGPSELLRHHVPDILEKLRKTFPKLRLQVLERSQKEALDAVEMGEVDLGVTVLEKSLPPGVRSERLVDLPLVLYVPKTWKPKECLPEKGSPLFQQPLIALPGHELLTRTFQEHLARHNLRWPVSIEANSGEQILHYVSRGLGAGLWVHTVMMPHPAHVRRIPLKDFPAVPVGAFWRGELPPPARAFLDEVRQRAHLYKVKSGLS